MVFFIFIYFLKIKIALSLRNITGIKKNITNWFDNEFLEAKLRKKSVN